MSLKNYNHPHQFIQSHVISTCSVWSWIGSFVNPWTSSLVHKILIPLAWSRSYSSDGIMELSRLQLTINTFREALGVKQNCLGMTKDFEMTMVKNLMRGHYNWHGTLFISVIYNILTHKIVQNLCPFIFLWGYPKMQGAWTSGLHHIVLPPPKSHGDDAC